jgi:hypothetical protein
VRAMGGETHRNVDVALLAEHEPPGIPGDRVAAVIHSFLAHTINLVGPNQAWYLSNVSVHGFRQRTLTGDASSLTPVERAIAHALAS